jgi:hypothetical protein
MEIPALEKFGARRVGWIALLTIAAVAGSFVFAYATPFPAIAALAALHVNRRDAFVLTGVMWIANQTVGYGFLQRRGLRSLADIAIRRAADRAGAAATISASHGNRRIARIHQRALSA